MRPPMRFRPCVSAVLQCVALAGLAGLCACGHKEGEQDAPKFVAPGIAGTPVPPAPPEPTGGQPGLPVVHVQADALVTAGTGGHRAQVSGDPGLLYQWFIQGGSFDGDTHGDSVAWTAGAPGEVRLFCQGTNAAGKASVALARVESEPAPSIDQFEARPAVISAGRSARLSWSAKEIKALVLDPGAQDVSKVSGPGFEVKPQETTRYILSATNAAGAHVSRSVEVKVVPAPRISALRAGGAISFGQTLSVVGEFSGGHAVLSRGGSELAHSDSSPLAARAESLKAGDAFTLIVTNEAGDSVTRTISFNPPVNPSAPAPQK